MRSSRLLLTAFVLLASLLWAVGVIPQQAVAQSGGTQEGFFITGVNMNQATMQWVNSPYNLVSSDAQVSFYNEHGTVVLTTTMYFSGIVQHGSLYDYSWRSAIYTLPSDAKFVSGQVTAGGVTYLTQELYPLWRLTLPALLKRYQP